MKESIPDTKVNAKTLRHYMLDALKDQQGNQCVELRKLIGNDIREIARGQIMLAFMGHGFYCILLSER